MCTLHVTRHGPHSVRECSDGIEICCRSAACNFLRSIFTSAWSSTNWSNNFPRSSVGSIASCFASSYSFAFATNPNRVHAREKFSAVISGRGRSSGCAIPLLTPNVTSEHHNLARLALHRPVSYSTLLPKLRLDFSLLRCATVGQRFTDTPHLNYTELS